MKHPFEQLRAEYESLLPVMQLTKTASIQKTAARLVAHYHDDRYTSLSKQTGVPVIFIASSFEREASSNFLRSPAQGDPWNQVSVNVPKNRGPFTSWTAAGIDAYKLNGLEKVGASNWTWALVCYYGELFNGFGYRDYHAMRSPYLFGGTNLQQLGKYTSDGKFDDEHMDTQLGVVPMMMAMVLLAPELRLPGAWPFRATAPVGVSPASVPSIALPPVEPIKTPMATVDVWAVQQKLSALGFGPLLPDGNFGRQTSTALRAFEASKGLVADGLLDPQTVEMLMKS